MNGSASPDPGIRHGRAGIRPMVADDVPAVCSLYERVVRSGSPTPPAALVRYLGRTFLDDPWRDDDIPSLVHTDTDGRIVGFNGSHVRRVVWDGRPIRVAHSGPLVAAPDAPGVGALLTRRYLGGPQDATVTDGATDYMRRIWTGLGGHTAVASSVSWAKVLRPAAAAQALARRVGRPGLGRVLRVVGPAVDGVARGVARRFPNVLPRAPETTAEILTAGELVAQVDRARRRLRLHPDYDETFLAWLFGELAAVTTRGVPVRHLVRDADGRALGWYVYHLAEHGPSQVLALVAPSGRTGDVLDHLLRHADDRGAAVVIGRLEPALLPELLARRCALMSTGLYTLVHSADPALLAVLGTPDALFSPLDGTAWMGHGALFADDVVVRA